VNLTPGPSALPAIGTPAGGPLGDTGVLAVSWFAAISGPCSLYWQIENRTSKMANVDVATTSVLTMPVAR